MASHPVSKLGAALSALATAVMFVAAGAGSTTAQAQTSTLQAPASSQRMAPRTGLNAAANAPATNFAAPTTSPLAAPLAAPLAQSGLGPTLGPVPTTAPAAGTKKYVLKAQVVPGASLNATQKVAVASAALAEILKQAKEQQGNVKQQTLSQDSVTVTNGPTLTVRSPASDVYNAGLTLDWVRFVDFAKNYATFDAGTLKMTGNMIGFMPAAFCHFNAPEAGFYMVSFTVAMGYGGTVTAYLYPDPAGMKEGNIAEAKATLTRGQSVVAVVREVGKGESMISAIGSTDAFNFNACEINRVK